jgi:hypothetical protein
VENNKKSDTPHPSPKREKKPGPPPLLGCMRPHLIGFKNISFWLPLFLTFGRVFKIIYLLIFGASIG